MKIMRVRADDGTIIEIPLGKGANGKSAYQYAQEGGYTGTEAQFMQILGKLDQSVLPTVTTADNGKFLRVVDGAWTTATIPSAEGVGF